MIRQQKMRQCWHRHWVTCKHTMRQRHKSYIVVHAFKELHLAPDSGKNSEVSFKPQSKTFATKTDQFMNENIVGIFSVNSEVTGICKCRKANTTFQSCYWSHATAHLLSQHLHRYILSRFFVGNSTKERAIAWRAKIMSSKWEVLEDDDRAKGNAGILSVLKREKCPTDYLTRIVDHNVRIFSLVVIFYDGFTLSLHEHLKLFCKTETPVHVRRKHEFSTNAQPRNS